jgi:hypothetical protein
MRETCIFEATMFLLNIHEMKKRPASTYLPEDKSNEKDELVIVIFILFVSTGCDLCWVEEDDTANPFKSLNKHSVVEQDYFYSDPDPCFYFDAAPNPDPTV